MGITRSETKKSSELVMGYYIVSDTQISTKAYTFYGLHRTKLYIHDENNLIQWPFSRPILDILRNKIITF